MTQVLIKSGIGRCKLQIINQVLPLIKLPVVEENGKIAIRVDGTGTKLNHHNTKVFVNSEEDFSIIHDSADEVSSMETDGNVKIETKEEIEERITETFEVMKKITRGVAGGLVRGIVFSGAAGVGKTHTITEVLEECGLVEKYKLVENMDFIEDEENGNKDAENAYLENIILSGKKVFDVAKGHVTAASLFEILYRNRYENCTIVLDDIDSIFSDEKALNILKAALDTSSTRRITWASMGGRKDDVPSVFEFKGNVIFISNKDFDNLKEKANVGKHIEALLSRCLFLNLKINTVEEKMVRIKQVAIKEGLFKRNNVSCEEEQEKIMEWVNQNAYKFRELSLRTIVHISTISKMDGWEAIAKNTLLV